MKNIDMARNICTSLINQIDNLKNKERRNDDWKIDTLNGKLEILQSLLRDPDNTYEEISK